MLTGSTSERSRIGNGLAQNWKRKGKTIAGGTSTDLGEAKVRMGGKNPRAEINTDRLTARERAREMYSMSSAREDTVMAGKRE